MITPYFYHKTIRRTITVFGTLFNNLKIRNVNDDNNGEEIKESRVPLSYASRDKLLARIKTETDLETNQKVAITLPRMSFEITSMEYAPETSISMIRNVNHKTTGDAPLLVRNNTRSGTPYRIGIQLNIVAKRQDEALQILEQILPYFKPTFNVTVKQLEDKDSTWDMPITLGGVSLQDTYEGDMETLRTIIYTLDFNVLVNLFGPLSTMGVIQKVIVNYYDYNDPNNIIERAEIEAIPASPSDNGYRIETNYFDLFASMKIDDENE